MVFTSPCLRLRTLYSAERPRDRHRSSRSNLPVEAHSVAMSDSLAWSSNFSSYGASISASDSVMSDPVASFFFMHKCHGKGYRLAPAVHTGCGHSWARPYPRPACSFVPTYIPWDELIDYVSQRPEYGSLSCLRCKTTLPRVMPC